MRKRKERKVSITEQEEELIMAIRNYVNSYPRGYPDLLLYARRLFENLVDPFGEED